jgi:hypothetical protein
MYIANMPFIGWGMAVITGFADATPFAAIRCTAAHDSVAIGL